MEKNNFFIESLNYIENDSLNLKQVEEYLDKVLLFLRSPPSKETYLDINYAYLIAIEYFYQNNNSILSKISQIKQLIAKNYDKKYKFIQKHILHETVYE